MRRFCLGLMMAAQLGSVATAASADDRPTLSVLPYEAPKGGLSAEQAAELADDLAARLVESGRFRLLLQRWLPGPSVPERTQSVQAARAAASEAGVEYLVVVSVQGLASPSSRPPAIVRIGAALLGWRGRAQLARPCPPVRPRRSTVILELALVSVPSGEIVRTSIGRVQMTVASAMTSASVGCGTLAGLGPGPSASPSLDLDSLKRANADLARALTVPPDLRAR